MTLINADYFTQRTQGNLSEPCVFSLYYLHERKKLNKEQNVQECDAAKVAQRIKAGDKKNHNLSMKRNQRSGISL